MTVRSGALVANSVYNLATPTNMIKLETAR